MSKQRTSPPRTVVDPRVGLGFLITLFVLIGAASLTFSRGYDAINSARSVPHNQEVITDLKALNGALTAAESATRGFSNQGDTTFREAFEKAERDVTHAFDTLANDVSRRDSKPKLERIQITVDAKMEFLRDYFKRVDSLGFEKVKAAGPTQKGVGVQLMEDAREAMRDLETSEYAAFNEGLRITDEASQIATVSFWITSLVSIILLTTLYALVRKHLEATAQARDADIKHAAELESRVLTRTAQLKAVNDELEAFSYSVSHDLRAPLRAIAGYTSILEEDLDKALTRDDRDNLGRIKANVTKMSGLIDDLLKLSRSTRGEMSIEPFDVSASAESILAELQTKSQRDGVEVTIQPDMVANGDHRMLQILLENLLQNAWKFTSKKESATIEVGCDLTDGDEVFFVRDTGAGFDAEYVEKAFEPFHRLHTDREFEGTGLGLAICKRIVQRHGGKIWADSKVGEGTIVQFTLTPAMSLES